MSQLRVMTLNLWNLQGPWEERMRLVRMWIDRLQPDLIGFQEAIRGPDVDQSLDLLSGTDYVVEYSAPGPFWRDPSFEAGNAIASRWPIQERMEIELPQADDVRGALLVKVATPYGLMPFVCTHLSYRREDGAARERQVVALARAIILHRDSCDLPPVLVGDFNTEPDSAEIRFLTGAQSLDGLSVYLRDAWQHAGGDADGATWSNRNAYARDWLEPDLRIDYIFVGPPSGDGVGDIENCVVVCDEPEDEMWPSDHFGVVADLRMESIPGINPLS